MASTNTLTHADLFSRLDSALIASEFARITDEHDTHAAAEREVRTAVAIVRARGYILDALNCEVGDEVQNLHCDTGTITHVRASAIAPRIEVRWDVPTDQRTVFTAAHLAAGELHRRH